MKSIERHIKAYNNSKFGLETIDSDNQTDKEDNFDAVRNREAYNNGNSDQEETIIT